MSCPVWLKQGRTLHADMRYSVLTAPAMYYTLLHRYTEGQLCHFTLYPPCNSGVIAVLQKSMDWWSADLNIWLDCITFAGKLRHTLPAAIACHGDRQHHNVNIVLSPQQIAAASRERNSRLAKFVLCHDTLQLADKSIPCSKVKSNMNARAGGQRLDGWSKSKPFLIRKHNALRSVACPS